MEVTETELKTIIKKFDKQSDDLVFILRAHLIVEEMLEKILKNKLPKSKVLLTGREQISFFDKLRIIQAMDLFIEGVYPALIELNALRNMLAHNLNHIITKEDVNKIGIQLKDSFEDLKRKYSKELNVKESDGSIKKKSILLNAVIYNLVGRVYRIVKESELD